MQFSDKKTLRARVRSLYKSAELLKYTPQALREISEHMAFRNARHVVLYMADGIYEIPFTEALLRTYSEKEYFFPVVVPDNRLVFYRAESLSNFVTGRYGTLEPPKGSARWLASQTETLILVPALAADRSGNRLGRGKGYYDRTLAAIVHAKNVHTMTVLPSFAVFEHIPAEEHDVPINTVLAIDSR